MRALRAGAPLERLEALRRDLKDLEGDLQQLHATWIEFMEAIEDLDYLQRIRELGTVDIQQLSAALSALRTELRSLGARGAPAVSQPEPARTNEAPAGVVASGPTDPVGNESRPSPIPVTSVINGATSSGVTPSAPKARPKVKLDPLRIPSFDGELLSFSEFKRNFQALVERQGYEEEVCLLYLKDALPKSLDYLLVGARDMQTAWGRLTDRYGDDRLRIRALYDQLMKLELKGREFERLDAAPL